MPGARFCDCGQAVPRSDAGTAPSPRPSPTPPSASPPPSPTPPPPSAPTYQQEPPAAASNAGVLTRWFGFGLGRMELQLPQYHFVYGDTVSGKLVFQLQEPTHAQRLLVGVRATQRVLNRTRNPQGGTPSTIPMKWFSSSK